MNSSAILARTEENTRASYFYSKTAAQEEFWDKKTRMPSLFAHY